VHHEDGFNEDEAVRLNPRRNWYRRFALDRADALVVPSHGLEAIALHAWHQPRAKVHRIPNGIDTRAFARKPKPDALPGLIKHKGERWVGTLAGLRAVKNLPRLVRAFAGLPEEWQLVILGEGPERAAIEREARAQGIEHRVHLPGFIAQPETAVGLFDVFALSSDSEQFPVSVIQALAAGLPVAAPAVGDIADMVAAENAPFVVAQGDEQALARALQELAEQPRLRATIGAANRARASADFDERAMIARYAALYAAAIGRPRLP
jgi:glycosyltransferase involved in cell wall biosynthesis